MGEVRLLYTKLIAGRSDMQFKVHTIVSIVGVGKWVERESVLCLGCLFVGLGCRVSVCACVCRRIGWCRSCGCVSALGLGSKCSVVLGLVGVGLISLISENVLWVGMEG